MSNDGKIALKRRLQFGACRCPQCGCEGYVPAHRIDEESRRLARYGFRAVKCPKCGQRFFRWSLQPLTQKSDDQAKEAGTAQRSGGYASKRKGSLSRSTNLPGIEVSAILLVLVLGAGVVAFVTRPREPNILEPVPGRLTALQVSVAFSEMESANRGFLISGDPAYRANFNVWRDQFSSGFRELMKACQQDNHQAAHMLDIKTEIDRWFKLYNGVINARRETKITPSDADLQSCRLEYEVIRDKLARLPEGPVFKP